ncbi:MAG TPA: inner membrane-spanning protein YciB [Steroidobacteraceae bacterium]|nr:inner membrane-spanning protein YciB [Steroidobacteraceae bacterium]
MQSISELAPLVAFIVTYYLRGLYTATAVLMVAMLLLLLFDWLRQRRIPPLHALSALLVLIFGAATLILHDRQYIQWKPTVFFWLASLAFIGSFWIGERTLTERLLGAAFGERLKVSARVWAWLNGAWVVFYALLGALNLLVAHYASERAWVTFKVFGLTLLTFAFVALQVFWLAARAGAPGAAAAPQ